eukprot:3093180-Pyramimonas_sp.AAC.1
MSRLAATHRGLHRMPQRLRARAAIGTPSDDIVKLAASQLHVVGGFVVSRVGWAGAKAVGGRRVSGGGAPKTGK